MIPGKIAYFSMEIGIVSDMPTYSGGLGVLAGDTIHAAADLHVSMVAVTLLHRKGYFVQRLDSGGKQVEEPVEWRVDQFLTELTARVSVVIEGRTVSLRAWKYEVAGPGDFSVPIYFLDADLPENSDWDRTLTHYLYGGDARYRLAQEIILGIGGVRMLRALGYCDIERFHMNEGHSSLLTLELLEEAGRPTGGRAVTPANIEAVRKKCVFTTHTPVPAGHDQFSLELVRQVLGRQEYDELKDVSFFFGDQLNMTYLALTLSGYVNGVAKKHGEISRGLFAGYNIDDITNGIHPATWAANPCARLFDRHIPGWRRDGFSLRYALSIPKQDVWHAHIEAKKALIDYVNTRTDAVMNPDAFTIGFARRATAYKRSDLLFADLDRLKAVADKRGTLQIVYAGKAHPKDAAGKELIAKIFDSRRLLRDKILVAYLENYSMEIGKIMTAGVDVWLNTPQPPMEASGTSGMKAAVNGVPSFSVLDGWWIEGCIEGLTGWSIGPLDTGPGSSADHGQDAVSLYRKLEDIVMPLYYHDRDGFLDVMRHAIALNGSFFNTHRMLQQYVLKAYL